MELLAMLGTAFLAGIVTLGVVLEKTMNKNKFQDKENVDQPQPDENRSTTKKRISYHEKVKKGIEYEEQIAKLYTAKGYTVIENGKKKGRKDGGIDLIATKDNETILIQCKNWKETSSYKIRHQEIKKLRSEARDFLEDHNEYFSRDLKLLFVLSENTVHPSASHYLDTIKDKGKKVDIKIISFEDAKKEIDRALETIIEERKKCPRCNTGYLVRRETKNKKLSDKYKNKEFMGCSCYPKCRYTEDIEEKEKGDYNERRCDNNKK